MAGQGLAQDVGCKGMGIGGGTGSVLLALSSSFLLQTHNRIRAATSRQGAFLPLDELRLPGTK